MLSLRSDVGPDFQKRGFYKLSLFDILEELIADAKERLWSTCLLPDHPVWPPQLWLTLRTMGLEPSYPEVTRSQKDNNSHQTMYKDSITHIFPNGNSVKLGSELSIDFKSAAQLGPTELLRPLV